MACASPLASGDETAREVRKTVTVIFCDVVGSTELGERFDPEVMRGVMARFYAAAREPIERHGGTVEKVIGDALVAVFGIPVVHEDDALRAVRAALEMRDAVRAMGDIQARIGVNTGDVLARDATPGESLVVGDAVNVAARLEQAAAPGEVLVGAATWALVAHAARGERVAPVAAKGKREPLPAWRLEGVDPSAHGQRRRLDLPMIGREAELDLLRWTLDRTDQHRAAAPGDGARPARDRQVPARPGGAPPGSRPHDSHRAVPRPRRGRRRSSRCSRSPAPPCRRAPMPRPRSPTSCPAIPTPPRSPPALCPSGRPRPPTSAGPCRA